MTAKPKIKVQKIRVKTSIRAGGGNTTFQHNLRLAK
jgi:hypothetical protein